MPLLLDRKSGKVRFDWRNPGINWDAHLKRVAEKRQSQFEQARQSQFEQALEE